MLYLAIYVYLIRSYFAYIKRHENIWVAAAGLTVCFGYLVFSLSDIFLSVKMGIGNFIIINALLLRILHCEESQADQRA